MNAFAPDRGATLLELLVALVIAGSLTAVLALGLQAPGNRVLDRTAFSIRSDLERARIAALASGSPQLVVLGQVRSDAATVFALVGDESRHLVELPPGVGVRFTGASTAAGSDAAAIAFFEDGTSTGGELTIFIGAQAVTLKVNWMTGHVY